jgi:hypothetical protein
MAIDLKKQEEQHDIRAIALIASSTVILRSMAIAAARPNSERDFRATDDGDVGGAWMPIALGFSECLRAARDP